MDCSTGLDDFYQELLTRQQDRETDSPDRSFRLLCFDEWASYLNTLDKKVAEAEKLKMATLLNLGRSYNIHILVSQQRADAAYFSTARDNFQIVLAMGNISKESKQMFFSGHTDEMTEANNTGEGYMLINGAELNSFVVPPFKDGDMDKVHQAIRIAVGGDVTT
jgi:DNA segregation ATPase FtsK/SpoIIIE-like protein